MLKFYIVAVGMLAAVLLIRCTSTTASPPSQHKTFNPKILVSMYSSSSNDGVAILENKGLQTAMNLTFVDAAGDRGAPEFVYVRTVRVGNRESWITQSPSNPLDLPGGEGVMVSFPIGLDMPIKVTWTQVDINGIRSTVSKYVN